MSLVVKTLLGDLPPIDITAQHNVIDLKRRIDEMRPEFPLKRQRLFVPTNASDDDSDAQLVELDLNRRTLESYHVTAESKVVLVLTDPVETRLMDTPDYRDLNEMINCRDQNAVENMLNARTGVLDVSQVMRCPDSDCSVTFDVIVAALLRNHSINNLYFPLHFALAVDQMHAFNDLLRHNISITELSLNGSLIPEELFGIVAPGLSENSVIRTLKIGNIRNNSARGAAVLAHALSTHTSIAIADLSLCSHLVAYLPALGVNLSITDLKLCRTSWTVNEGQLLADALVRNSTLKSLNLSMSFMNGDVFRAMMPGFAANQTLERLNFTAVFTNSAENDCVDLAELISQASSLRTLILSSTLFSDDAISRFAAALASNTTLTRLNLSYSSISDCHMQALCSALEQNIHLAELSLVRNAFGHRGIQSLNKMLQRNLALRNLSLAENPLAFDAVGWNLFAKTLQGNRTLTQVDLPSILHIFTNDMFHSLAAVLSNNSTLTRLKLNDQTYSCGDGSGIAAVASALQHNYTLTDLQIRTGSQGPNDVLVRIRALCRRNSLQYYHDEDDR